MKSLLLLAATAFYCSITYGQGISIPYDAATVTVDGVMNGTEWENASTLAISVSATDSVQVYYKHDMNALYFAYTGKLESANALFPEVLIDPQLAMGNSWVNSQWWFHVSATDCENNGAYGVYSNCKAVQPDWEGANNFVTGAPYTDTVEIKIPFSKIGFNPATENEMGMAFLVTNTASIWKLWPSAADRAIPATWSKATVSKFPVGIQDAQAYTLLNIYPNPATDFIVLEGFEKDCELRITDINGRVMIAKHCITGERVPVAALSAGVYNVQLYQNRQLLSKRTIQKL